MVNIVSVDGTYARTYIVHQVDNNLVRTRLCNVVHHSLQRGTDRCIFYAFGDDLDHVTLTRVALVIEEAAKYVLLVVVFHCWCGKP